MAASRCAERLPVGDQDRAGGQSQILMIAPELVGDFSGGDGLGRFEQLEPLEPHQVEERLQPGAIGRRQNGKGALGVRAVVGDRFPAR
jgi:hypothetical protein